MLNVKPREINKVFLESNLSKFKLLDGNRGIEESRVEKIIDSIKTVGFINSPIVCNEHYEIIDGQGRLEACKRLGLPIPYIVIDGLGVDECRAMNVNQKNWSTLDFISSYANEGNPSYKYLLDFVRTSGFPFSTSIWIAVQRKYNPFAIRKGTLVFSEQDYIEARKLCDFLHKFDRIKTNRQKEFLIAIARVSELKEVDSETLFRKVCKNPRSFENISGCEDCVEVIERIYNFRRHGNKVFIKALYQQHIFELKTIALKKGDTK